MSLIEKLHATFNGTRQDHSIAVDNSTHIAVAENPIHHFLSLLNKSEDCLSDEDISRYYQKLSALFPDTEKASNYINACSTWGYNNTGNPLVFPSEITGTGVNDFWNKLTTNTMHTNTNFLKFLMHFSLPEGEFNQAGRAQLIIESPEMRTYLSQASEIEGYIQGEDESFPSTAQEMKFFILRYSMDALNLNDGSLYPEAYKAYEGQAEITQKDWFRNDGSPAITMHYCAPLKLCQAVQNLAQLGVFDGALITINKDIEFAVTPRDGEPSEVRLPGEYEKSNLQSNQYIANFLRIEAMSRSQEILFTKILEAAQQVEPLLNNPTNLKFQLVKDGDVDPLDVQKNLLRICLEEGIFTEEDFRKSRVFGKDSSSTNELIALIEQLPPETRNKMSGISIDNSIGRHDNGYCRLKIFYDQVTFEVSFDNRTPAHIETLNQQVKQLMKRAKNDTGQNQHVRLDFSNFDGIPHHDV